MRAGLLSGGEKQMLALGMIILNTPKLLLLDEPSAGLVPALVKGMMGKIVEINQAYTIAVLLVEQKVKECLTIASRGYIIKNGQVVMEGEPDKIKENISKEIILSRLERGFLSGLQYSREGESFFPWMEWKEYHR